MNQHAFPVSCVVRGIELGGGEKITPVASGDIGLALVELSRGTDVRTESIAVVLAMKSSHIWLATRGEFRELINDGTDVSHLH